MPLLEIPSDALHKSACQVCQGEVMPSAAAWISRCSSCGVLSSKFPVLIPEHVAESKIDEDERGAGLMAVRQRNNALLFDLLRGLGKSSGRMLDVGSGQGQLCIEASRRGFTVIGIEPDANVINQARAISGVEIRHGYFPTPLAQDELFDVIVFNDVLEHIPDARAAVAASARHLNCGGILILNCPNQSGIFYKIASLLSKFGLNQPLLRLWQSDLPSPHVWYFRPDHLVALGKLTGLEEAKIETLPLIVSAGLKERIFFVKNQSALWGYGALFIMRTLLPALKFLPHDTAIVFLRKPDERSKTGSLRG